MAAGGERAGDVPAAAGPDDQGFGAGTQIVGEAGPLVQEIPDVGRGKVVEVEIGDGGGGVGVDVDHFTAAFLIAAPSLCARCCSTW